VDKEIGMRLRQARESAGLSQEDVAFAIDNSQTAVSRAERGVTRSGETVRRMTLFLGLNNTSPHSG